MTKPIPHEIVGLFEAMLDAATHGRLGIISTEDKATGEPRYVLAVGHPDGSDTLTIEPIGYLSETVVDEVDPPDDKGGLPPVVTIPDEPIPLPAMDDFTATMIAEGAMEASEDRQLLAWQHLVDTGLAWKLQGFFGRTAQRLIDEGTIQPANHNEGETDAA